MNCESNGVEFKERILLFIAKVIDTITSNAKSIKTKVHITILEYNANL